MLNKKGFISMSLIYSFFIFFIALVLALLANYSQNRILIRKVSDQIKDDLTAKYAAKTKKLADAIIEANGGIAAIDDKGSPNLSSIANTALTSGLYRSIDDQGATYYFRGVVTNNYVTFAGYSWRVIRINGDGSVRLIYNGSIGNSVFNSGMSDGTLYNAFVGYTFGNPNASSVAIEHYNSKQNDSNIKTTIDSWYVANILNKDSGVWHNLIADNIFCADRDGTGNRFGAATSYYGSYGRNVNYKAANFKCNIKPDQYTVSLSLGNGILTYPIGLITADEVAFAGSVYGTNNTVFYLYNGSSYWTMSASHFATSAYAMSVNNGGALTSSVVNTSMTIRPVINISNRSIVESGNGTSANPYVIKKQ